MIGTILNQCSRQRR